MLDAVQVFNSVYFEGTISGGIIVSIHELADNITQYNDPQFNPQ